MRLPGTTHGAPSDTERVQAHARMPDCASMFLLLGRRLCMRPCTCVRVHVSMCKCMSACACAGQHVHVQHVHARSHARGHASPVRYTSMSGSVTALLSRSSSSRRAMPVQMMRACVHARKSVAWASLAACAQDAAMAPEAGRQAAMCRRAGGLHAAGAAAGPPPQAHACGVGAARAAAAGLRAGRVQASNPARAAHSAHLPVAQGRTLSCTPRAAPAAGSAPPAPPGPPARICTPAAPAGGGVR